MFNELKEPSQQVDDDKKLRIKMCSMCLIQELQYLSSIYLDLLLLLNLFSEVDIQKTFFRVDRDLSKI